MFKHLNIPAKPGIYKMIDESGRILYIGKARELRKRVGSYFRKSAKHSTRIQKLVEQIRKVETIVVGSEEEALLLENNLIKEHRPKYNVLLRDDKNFLFIKITNEDFPHLELVRKRIKDGGYYIGPKTSGALIRESLEMLRKIYPFRTCNMGIKWKDGEVDLVKTDRKTPCLDYHIGICTAPCIAAVDPQKYKLMFDDIKDFFKGKFERIATEIEAKMYKYSTDKKYELAGKMRDILKIIQTLREKQIIINPNDFSNIDVAGLARFKNKSLVKLLVFRKGKLAGDETVFMDSPEEEPDSEILEKFVNQYYTDPIDPPSEIILQERVPFISSTINLCVPKLGRKKELLDLAAQNAVLSLENQIASFEKEEEDNRLARDGLEHLAKIIGAKKAPDRLECYDISHLGGTHTYASMVVFENGKPKISHYRRFKIVTVGDGNIDDFASLAEAMTRRLSKLKSKKKTGIRDVSFSSRPDLIIIDGGKGQLSSCIKILKDLKLKIPMLSIAKQEEELFLPGKSESVRLDKTDETLKLIQRIRDEAHRFAITANKDARIRGAKESILDNIPGIGASTKRLILKKYGSIKRIKEVPENELIALIGTQKTILLKQYL